MRASKRVKKRPLTGDVFQLRGTVTPFRTPESIKKVRTAAMSHVARKAGSKKGSQSLIVWNDFNTTNEE